jgi:pimeloyl-ACP methyl ester carboxylesterase/DNA-binding CsgD family transcriptional regulator
VDPPISFTTAADGVKIGWTATGAGPTLIHLPGVPFSNFEAEWRVPAMRQTFGRLGDHLRLIQYDGRGTGSSQRDVTDVSLDAHLRDLDAVVAAAGADQFVLLGFYHSATHAIGYAARHPEQVRGFVSFGGSLRDWDTFAESIAHAWLGWSAGEEGRLAADWFRTASSPAVTRATLQAASAVDVRADAARVRCPALVLHREHASVIDLEVSQELADALPNGHLEVLPGSSATLFLEETDRVVDRLVAFVRDPGGPVPAATARRVPRRGSGGLSGREIEVLRLLASGDTNAEIAGRLGLSVNTIERHVGNIYRKIDARGRADATAYAIRRGLA